LASPGFEFVLSFEESACYSSAKKWASAGMNSYPRSINVPWPLGALRRRLGSWAAKDDLLSNVEALKAPAMGAIDQHGQGWVLYDPHILKLFVELSHTFSLPTPDSGLTALFLRFAFVSVILETVYQLPAELNPKHLDQSSLELLKLLSNQENKDISSSIFRQALASLVTEFIVPFPSLILDADKQSRLSFLRQHLSSLAHSKESTPDFVRFSSFMNAVKKHAESAADYKEKPALQEWLSKLFTDESTNPLRCSQGRLCQRDIFQQPNIQIAAHSVSMSMQDWRKNTGNTLEKPLTPTDTVKDSSASTSAALLESVRHKPQETLTTIGRYTILRLLGSGTMGDVYLAKDPEGRSLALKVLKTSAASLDADLTRFSREIEISMSLDHPHLAKTYDYGTQEELIFFTMEYLPGGSLADRLGVNKALSERESWPIILQVAKALDYTSNLPKSYIHRDIKAANILFDAAGQARLVDFGLAAGVAQDATRFTQVGESLGTPAYMAPEQIEDSRSIDIRADLWSLGVLSYRMLTGYFPFPGPSLGELIIQVIDGTPKGGRDRFQQLSKESQDIVNSLLVNDRERRLQSPKKLIDKLKHYDFKIAPCSTVTPTEDGLVLSFNQQFKIFLLTAPELVLDHCPAAPIQFCLRPSAHDRPHDSPQANDEQGRLYRESSQWMIEARSSNGLYINGSLLANNRKKILRGSELISLSKTLELDVRASHGSLLLSRHNNCPEHAYLWLQSSFSLKELRQRQAHWPDLNWTLSYRNGSIFLTPNEKILAGSQWVEAGHAICLSPELRIKTETLTLTVEQLPRDMFETVITPKQCSNAKPEPRPNAVSD
jgi:serine/threonine protein kinase